MVLILALPPVVANGQQAQSASSPSSRYQAPVIKDTSALKGPRQPIFFRHDVHAGQDQIPCMYCHYSAAISSEPGIPSLQTCMGCHQLIGGTPPSHQAEIKKVRDAWRERKSPEWIRVHALPGFVRFPHMRHIKALGTTAWRMGWCVRCHIKNNVTRDCSVCHY